MNSIHPPLFDWTIGICIASYIVVLFFTEVIYINMPYVFIVLVARKQFYVMFFTMAYVGD